MSIYRTIYLALATFAFSASALTIERRDGKPSLPYDDKTTKDCTYWVDYDGTQECAKMLEDNWATLENFRRWNPTIGPNCSGLTKGKSYCVEALFEAPPGQTSEVPSPSATPTPTPTPTAATGSIETPLPTQPDIVSNCDQFYLVKANEQCADIASRFGISLTKFINWNPKAGSTCSGLWADAYACVSIVGQEAAPVASASPTKPGNGITTPLPTQPNLVANCDKFYFVQKTEQCSAIAAANGISLTQFLNWNPSAGSTCGGLWAEAYACVSIVGHTPSTPKPTPTPTKPSNGVQTPSPIQAGMTTNCKKFDFVNKNEICDTIVRRNGISLANFVQWNSAVGSDCRSMWAETYVCVGV
ncbi:LysM domain-containing protein [Ophiobolus disseminans]|uniref:LysM domain-containing protein n=1 Tax=Ophiobolus disseminans TaxID=1469910 RepID=A0A6A6ZZ89_9PLEO|nr:LysM domain-containing protein [Ophiobolus disseminans]